IADWGRTNGFPVNPKDPNSIVAALRSALMRDPSTVSSWFLDGQGKMTIPGMTSQDAFTKEWNSYSGGIVGLKDLHTTIFDKPTANGLSLYDNLKTQLQNPHLYDQ